MAEMNHTESFGADLIEASKDGELSEQDLAAVSGGGILDITLGDIYGAVKAVVKAVDKYVIH
jgi:hypothetical protein